MSEAILLEKSDGVAVVTMNRPERLNSLTFQTYQELADLFDDLSADDAVRAVLLQGAGRGFCSGGDQDDIIAELFSRDSEGLLEFTRLTGDLIRSIAQCRHPVVGAVHGVAVGAGAVMALACDLRIGGPKTRFGFIFPRVGLSGADMGAAYLLPQVVGAGVANELLFGGEIIDASFAYRIGLLNSVAASGDECREEGLGWAKKLAAGPAFAHRMTKKMIAEERGMTLPQALEAEAKAQAICMEHPDFLEAHKAFKEKRSPRFEGA